MAKSKRTLAKAPKGVKGVAAGRISKKRKTGKKATGREAAQAASAPGANQLEGDSSSPPAEGLPAPPDFAKQDRLELDGTAKVKKGAEVATARPRSDSDGGDVDDSPPAEGLPGPPSFAKKDRVVLHELGQHAITGVSANSKKGMERVGYNSWDMVEVSPASLAGNRPPTPVLARKHRPAQPEFGQAATLKVPVESKGKERVEDSHQETDDLTSSPPTEGFPPPLNSNKGKQRASDNQEITDLTTPPTPSSLPTNFHAHTISLESRVARLESTLAAGSALGDVVSKIRAGSALGEVASKLAYLNSQKCIDDIDAEIKFKKASPLQEVEKQKKTEEGEKEAKRMKLRDDNERERKERCKKYGRDDLI
ncbi:hypothetical protein EJ06DRAFT_557224 [Trichodelitschia bisporula]|uniref:Uncharacterized protein n=1 Tax=Trichodelitschia bisporula TaxID=703511 RepID=A0A6G1HTI2_9PEZI|nr:hypothetical protein EJ06DRAFT_557224 [Trichodelitschia bisporula]